MKGDIAIGEAGRTRPVLCPGSYIYVPLAPPPAPCFLVSRTHLVGVRHGELGAPLEGELEHVGACGGVQGGVHVIAGGLAAWGGTGREGGDDYVCIFSCVVDMVLYPMMMMMYTE